jgi:Cu-Zn family superoxide dismutase
MSVLGRVQRPQPLHVIVALALFAVAFVTPFAAGHWLTAGAQGAGLPAGGGAAAAILYDTSGQTVGTALLAEQAVGTVAVFVVVVGLTPGDHGIHAHETGACDPGGEKAFASAGGHVNPTATEHGAHAGDLGNITVDDTGLAIFELVTDRFALTAGEVPLLDADGAAIVIHANRDENDPEGASFGGRIACGVLEAAGATPTASTPSS